MRTVSVKIGSQGRNWVAGLRWTSQNKALEPAEMRQEALHLRGNLYVARKPLRTRSMSEGSRYDVGYGSLPSEGRSGAYYSLGALLSQTRKGPWTATFDMGNEVFLYVAVLDGNSIDPEHGEVVGSRADVDKARDVHKDMGLAHTEYSSADLAQFVDESIGELVRVKFLDGSNSTFYAQIALIVFAVTALGLGGWWYMHHRASVQRFARLRAAVVRRKSPLSQATIPANPLSGTVLPSVLLKACDEAVNTIRVGSDGWLVSSIECGQGGAKVVWKATRYASYERRPTGVLADDSTDVSRIPFSLQASAAGEVSLPLDVQVARLRDIVSRAGATFDTRAMQGPLLPGQSDSSTPSSAPQAYRQQIFTVTLRWAPWSVPFDQVPGLRLDTIRFSGTNWSVEGSVYGN